MLTPELMLQSSAAIPVMDVFSAPADISTMSEVLRDQNLHFSFATPIGYQPFMRCAHQSGYIIEAGEPYDLYKDATYTKHKFRLHRRALSMDIP